MRVKDGGEIAHICELIRPMQMLQQMCIVNERKIFKFLLVKEEITETETIASNIERF